MSLTSTLRTTLLPALAAATPRPAIEGAGRVLILQPDHLGDILLSEPAVRLLRHHLPDTELIAVVGPWSAEITRMAWQVDRVEEVSFPAFSRDSNPHGQVAPYVQLRREIDRLRNQQADDALILRDDAWWAAWLARGSVGRHVVTSNDRRTGAFASHQTNPETHVHRTASATEIVRSYLKLLGQDLVIDYWDMSPRMLPNWSSRKHPSSGERQATRQSTVIAIHPGSGADVKLWPVRNWRSAIDQLSDFRIVLTGSHGEREMCKEIAQDFDHVTVVAGETSLQQLAALFAQAALAVGTDNGPMHLAGALGTPTLRLFGPSNPERYGPWPGTPAQLIASACWSCPRCEDLSQSRKRGCGCMASISPDQVVGLIRTILDDAA